MLQVACSPVVLAQRSGLQTEVVMRIAFPFSKVLGLAAAFLAAALPVLLQGQAIKSIDVDAARMRITPVDTNWQFHLGDDPAWAQPAFDDSHWPVLHIHEDWEPQGYPDHAEFGWVRFHLQVAAHTSSLVLQLPRINKNYQLFCDGQLVGHAGDLPPNPARDVTGTTRVFTLPIQAGNDVKQVTVALRLWQSTQLAGILSSAVGGRAFIGEPATILRQFGILKSAKLLTLGNTYSVDMISCVVAAATLLLFWLIRERFYLWFACYLVINALNLPIQFASEHFAWSFQSSVDAYIWTDVLSEIALILFILDALRVVAWKRVMIPIAFAMLAELGPILFLRAHLPSVWANSGYALFSSAVAVYLTRYLVRGWRAGSLYAKLLLIPFLIDMLLVQAGNIGHALVDLNVPHADRLITTDIYVLQKPFNVSLNDIGEVIALMGYLAVLVYRFASTNRERQRLASALKAAHDIQQRLVPVDIPTLGGLHAEIVYLAAEEVGGDFCQILPRPDGSIFIAIGDVSGKGLQAAMVGAVAVGALRSMADEEIEPAAVLERLNNVLLRAGDTGFSTCLCMILGPSGEMRIANAGHLAPYLDGVEIPLPPNLPLGILANVTYEPSIFVLPAKARLTLLSDGVVEARSHGGELFGFERTCLISRLPASEIAAQASLFGQEDDITVITLDWHTVGLAIA